VDEHKRKGSMREKTGGINKIKGKNGGDPSPDVKNPEGQKTRVSTTLTGKKKKISSIFPLTKREERWA